MLENPPRSGLPDEQWCDAAQSLWQAIHSGDWAKAVRIVLDAPSGKWREDLINLREHGMTPLIWLVRSCLRPTNQLNDRLDLIRTLLKAGAARNAKDQRHGMTALHYAAAHPHLGITRMLLDYGATVNLEDSRGLKPRDTAEYMKTWLMNNDAGYDRMIEYLDSKTPTGA